MPQTTMSPTMTITLASSLTPTMPVLTYTLTDVAFLRINELPTDPGTLESQEVVTLSYAGIAVADTFNQTTFTCDCGMVTCH